MESDAGYLDMPMTLEELETIIAAAETENQQQNKSLATGKPAAEGKAARKRAANQEPTEDSTTSAANQDPPATADRSGRKRKVQKVVAQRSLVSNGYDSDTRDE